MRTPSSPIGYQRASRSSQEDERRSSARAWRSSSPSLRRALLLHSLLFWLVGGCRQILGIEDAEIDPGVASPSSAGSSSDGGDGGSTESGGSDPSGGSGNTTGDAGEGASESDGGSESGGGTDPGSGGAQAGSNTSGDAGSGGSDEPPPPSLCQTYCATIMANCTEHPQYADEETCLAVCHALPEGTAGDSDVNTVQCRLSEAKKAAGGEPEFYCPFAGPGGGGGCGEDCDGYCSLMMSLCTAQNTGGLYYYPSFGACKQECKALPLDGSPYDPELHSAGPHFQCRLFHACSAVADPDYHCGHALGEPPCQITEPPP